MKGLVLMVCVLATGSSFAQEEKHLEGTKAVEESASNIIVETAKRRAEMETVISVYPNPSQGNLFIEGNVGSIITVNSMGGTYVGTWIIGAEQKVEITDLPLGSFLCTINDGEIRTVKRILVL